MSFKVTLEDRYPKSQKKQNSQSNSGRSARIYLSQKKATKNKQLWNLWRELRPLRSKVICYSQCRRKIPFLWEKIKKWLDIWHARYIAVSVLVGLWCAINAFWWFLLGLGDYLWFAEKRNVEKVTEWNIEKDIKQT